MKISNNNKIDAPEPDYLYKSPSQIPDSGNGLFTAIEIFKDETIAVFKGEILTGLQAKDTGKNIAGYTRSKIPAIRMKNKNTWCASF